MINIVKSTDKNIEIEYKKFLFFHSDLSFRKSVPEFRKATNLKISNENANTYYREFYKKEINVKKQSASKKRKKTIRKNQKKIIIEVIKKEPDLTFLSDEPIFSGAINEKWFKNNKNEIEVIFQRMRLISKSRNPAFLVYCYEYPKNTIYYGIMSFATQKEYYYNFHLIAMERGTSTMVYSLFSQKFKKWFTEKNIKKVLKYKKWN